MAEKKEPLKPWLVYLGGSEHLSGKLWGQTFVVGAPAEADPPALELTTEMMAKKASRLKHFACFETEKDAKAYVKKAKIKPLKPAPEPVVLVPAVEETEDDVQEPGLVESLLGG